MIAAMHLPGSQIKMHCLDRNDLCHLRERFVCTKLKNGPYSHLPCDIWEFQKKRNGLRKVWTYQLISIANLYSAEETTVIFILAVACNESLSFVFFFGKATYH